MFSIKNCIVATFLFASATVYARSPVYNDTTYLGGALDPSQCSLIAGSNGFSQALFGAGYDYLGNYYPYWNACFGLYRRGGFPGGGGSTGGDAMDYHFYPYVRTGYDAARCIQQVERVSGIWGCSLWSSYIIECSPTRSMTYRSALSIANEMKRYSCVDFVDGPRERRR